MRGAGFLAIWSDVEAHDLTDYRHWLTREHTTERVTTKGFRGVRVFRAARDDINRFFILYELEAPEVLDGEAYLARLNAPTPWSQRIMPLLKNFARGGGTVVASAGIGQGGYIAALPFEAAEFDPAALVRELAQIDRVAAIRVLQTDTAQTSIQTREKSMRSADSSFGGLVLIEALDEPAARNAVAQLKKAVPAFDTDAAANLPLYAMFFGLHRRLLAG